jgi:5-bromo-4-chloroindolyl phosphate hydrolysis protein
MLQLLVNNYIKKSTGTKATGYHYEVVSMEEYETLKNSISTVLDEIITTLKQQQKVNSLQVVQLQNEPLQANHSNAKQRKSKSSVKEVSDQINLNKEDEAINS